MFLPPFIKILVVTHTPELRDVVLNELVQDGFDVDAVSLLHLLDHPDPARFMAERRPGTVVFVVEPPYAETAGVLRRLSTDVRLRCPVVAAVIDRAACAEHAVVANGVEIGAGPYEFAALRRAVAVALENYVPPERRSVERRGTGTSGRMPSDAERRLADRRENDRKQSAADGVGLRREKKSTE